MTTFNLFNHFKITDMKTKVKLEIEKELSLTDLKTSDHIGITCRNGIKYFVVKVKRLGYMILTSDNQSTLGGVDYGVRDNVQELINGAGKEFATAFVMGEVFKFVTRRELYQWLAE